MRGVRLMLGVGLALIVAAPAHAAFPGQNGKIAFKRDNGIWTVNPDGSARTQITTGARDFSPRWSPDGSQIAFFSTRPDPAPLTCTFCRYDVYVMDADGSDVHRVTQGSTSSITPSWSPDGTRLAFTRGFQIWTIKPDGTDEQRVTPDPTGECSSEYHDTIWSPDGQYVASNGGSDCYDHEYPISAVLRLSDGGPRLSWITTGADEIEDWSPDSQQLVFGTMGLESGMGMYKYRLGASGIEALTDTTYDDGFAGAAWSPDGDQIVFARASSYGSDPLLHFIDASDGSNITQLSAGDAYECCPDWQPLPINSYPRPKGASPTDVSLVPAYEPCTSPNRTHGPPLAFDSCNPPVQKPGQLTVGTPDANGQPAKLRAHVRINPLRGNPSTSADEADVRLRATVNDVRLRSDLSDYTGALELRLTLQITDRDNTPHPGGPGPATVQEFTHSQPLPCSTTPADATVGSTCQFDTTVEALVPGAVKELTRGIWQLERITVHDGAGNLFLTQGIFVP